MVLPMKSSTTLKLSPKLKARIARLAKRGGLTPHALMVDALERHVDREERHAAFVAEARESLREVQGGGDVYRAEDVHDWMRRSVAGEAVGPPKPWRG